MKNKTPFRFLPFLLFTLVFALLAPPPARSQAVTPRVRSVPFYAGTGLLAAGTSNNWTVAGPIGGLGGTYINTGSAKLNVNAGGAALTITYANHSFAASNALFRFSLSADGTNFAVAPTIDVFSGVSLYNLSGATNGFTIVTNIPETLLKNMAAIRCDGYTNVAVLSNVVITVSQTQTLGAP